MAVTHRRVEVIPGRAQRIVAVIVQIVTSWSDHQQPAVVETTIISNPTQILVANQLVLLEAPERTHGVDAASLAPEFLSDRFLVQTLVNVDAGFPVVIQHKSLGTDAERPPQRVEAGVRASPVVDGALVNVLTAVAVVT